MHALEKRQTALELWSPPSAAAGLGCGCCAVICSKAEIIWSTCEDVWDSPLPLCRNSSLRGVIEARSCEPFGSLRLSLHSMLAVQTELRAIFDLYHAGFQFIVCRRSPFSQAGADDQQACGFRKVTHKISTSQSFVILKAR